MGLIISSLISVLLELFNTTITTEEDLNDFYNLPMLGIITRFGHEDRKYPQYQYEYAAIKKGECE
jgi:capsular polysaccharide biosynthesis protein